jgi:beta-mannosidase
MQGSNCESLMCVNVSLCRWGDPADPRFGDVHFYNYKDDAMDPLTYPPAKFVSEFGYMSFPSFSAYQNVTEPQDWAIDSDMTNFRSVLTHGCAGLAPSWHCVHPLCEELGVLS